MRKLIMVATTVAALAIPSSALASASSIGGGTSANGVGTIQGGKNNQTQQYKASYVDPIMGPVACAGVHQTGKSYSAQGQDSFTCTSTTGSPLTNVYPGEVLTTADFGWFSDYYMLLGQAVLATNFTLTVSADGLSETGVASY